MDSPTILPKITIANGNQRDLYGKSLKDKIGSLNLFSKYNEMHRTF